MSQEIGTLKKVSIKSVWPNEERDFTPWLKEHGLPALLERLGVDDMMGAESEVRCGDGSKSEADLVVSYQDGEERKTMVIENQYGKSDADHLGRLLMYSAHQGASTVVWITEEEKPEYVTTINWLNENCSTALSFYLVRIALYAIGNSLPAPMFEVLAKPNEEGEKITKEKERSESMDICYGFWQSCFNDKSFLQALADAGLRQRKANADRWKDYSIGSSDVWLCASITTKEGRIKVCFTVKNGSAAYAKLMGDDLLEKMETCFGERPMSGQTETKTYSTINFYHDVDVAAGADQQAVARKWFGEMLPKMKCFLKTEGLI